METGKGKVGQEYVLKVRQGRAIVDKEGQGKAGKGRGGREGRGGKGRAGQGRAGQGRAGQGRAGQGRQSRIEYLYNTRCLRCSSLRMGAL